MSGRNLIAILTLSILLAGCGDDNPARPRQEPGWYALGLQDKTVRVLAFEYPYLYAGNWDGLYRADVTASETEWKYLGIGVAAVQTLDSGALLAAVDRHVLRSDDHGDSWINWDSGIRTTNGRLCQVTCFASCEEVVYAGSTECGFYRKTSSDTAWALVEGGPGIGYQQEEIRCHPVDYGIVWEEGNSARGTTLLRHSHDMGESWENLSPGRMLDSYTIALDPLNSNVVYVGMRGRVARSDDGGQSWTDILDLEGDPWLSASVHDPVNQGHVFFASSLYDKGTETYSPIVFETKNRGGAMDTLQAPVEGPIWEMAYDSRHKTLYVAAGVGVHKLVL